MKNGTEPDSSPSGPDPRHRQESFRFPSGFLWGTATSSHQVEGNNDRNDWWEAEQAGKLPHRSGDACRHYDLFEQDLDLASKWGHNAHRFSIEWSRCEPESGQWDAAEIDHYRAVVAAIRRRGMTPIVTLHHFTNPLWFARRGGWMRSDSAKLFGRYVEKVARSLGDSVDYWITLNEPTVLLKRAFFDGLWPPFHRRRLVMACRVLFNLSRAHRRAYRVLHSVDPRFKVGLSHSATVIQPCRPRDIGDRAAAALRDLVLNRALIRLAGGNGRRLDFLGLNYYTRAIVRKGEGFKPGTLLGRDCEIDHHEDRGIRSTCGLEIYPQGLTSVLRRHAALGIPLLITENGVATQDEEVRERFLLQHLRSLATAMASGVEVLGYIYWSLLDNFEWDLGYAQRYGLVGVDFDTQTRTARPAAETYASVCRANELSSDQPT